MSNQVTIDLTARLAELENVYQTVAQFAASMAWPEKILGELWLVLEELIVNVISHGCDGEHVPQIRVQVAQRAAIMTIEVADDGPAFDPLQLPQPDMNTDIDARAIGGLGIHLVRRLTDSAAYRRESGRNRLTLTKSVR
jgi:serine/threonine-protein kinase RsbW